MTETEILKANKTRIMVHWLGGLFMRLTLFFSISDYTRRTPWQFLFISLILARISEYIELDQFKLPIWPFNLLSNSLQ